VRQRNAPVPYSTDSPCLVSFCRETPGKAVLWAVRIYTEATEWLWWLRNSAEQERKKFAQGERREESPPVACCETHVTRDMLDINRKVGLGGPRAGDVPVVVQHVGDAHQVVG